MIMPDGRIQAKESLSPDDSLYRLKLAHLHADISDPSNDMEINIPEKFIQPHDCIMYQMESFRHTSEITGKMLVEIYSNDPLRSIALPFFEGYDTAVRSISRAFKDLPNPSPSYVYMLLETERHKSDESAFEIVLDSGICEMSIELEFGRRLGFRTAMHMFASIAGLPYPEESRFTDFPLRVGGKDGNSPPV